MQIPAQLFSIGSALHTVHLLRCIAHCTPAPVYCTLYTFSGALQAVHLCMWAVFTWYACTGVHICTWYASTGALYAHGMPAQVRYMHTVYLYRCAVCTLYACTGALYAHGMPAQVRYIHTVCLHMFTSQAGAPHHQVPALNRCTASARALHQPVHFTSPCAAQVHCNVYAITPYQPVHCTIPCSAQVHCVRHCAASARILHQNLQCTGGLHPPLHCAVINYTGLRVHQLPHNSACGRLFTLR